MRFIPVRQIKFLSVIALCVMASAVFARQQAKPSTPAAAKAAPPAASAPPNFQKTMGNPSAPITMEVFGDFQCPACRAFFEATTKQVIDDYVIPGKVYLVHRDFPLEMHPYARQAARLANAAANFGQFEAIERALYDHQEEWSTKGNIDEVIAASFPSAEFKKFVAFESQHMNEINASIERDRAMGTQRNVNQTPTVYITSHGKTEALPGGGVDYKLLKSYFDYLLRQ
ncbi:MAG TPA: thioredoxin domain-containing protein [Candidatus Sulfotelmatobacter sp.]|nr:thioredoxin domain-containing protein [Candidatus Sulfotelmatobacter sp.]